MKIFTSTILCVLFFVCVFTNTSSAVELNNYENLIKNGSFEDGLSNWKSFWSREPSKGSATLDNNEVHSGKASVRIEHNGKEDWSFKGDSKFLVKQDEMYEFDSWTKFQGDGKNTLCITTYDAQDKVLNWTYASITVNATNDWQLVSSKFMVPEGAVKIEPRWIGYGDTITFIDDITLKKLPDFINSEMPEKLSIGNEFIIVNFDTHNATFDVIDNTTKKTWSQKAVSKDIIVKNAEVNNGELALDLYNISSSLDIKATVILEKDKPEFSITMNGKGKLVKSLQYPEPFITDSGTSLIIPLNEGISYDVDDTTISPMKLVAYGGHGICMSFWGVTDGDTGYMSTIETPDDAAINISRLDNKLYVAPVWDSQKSDFGYARKIRYTFLSEGGYVDMCKDYREYVQKNREFKTLEEKKNENPNVDLLIGAANVWCFEKDSVKMVKEMKNDGMDKILWSSAQSAGNIITMNSMGVLTSKYDVYQDVMNPDNFPKLNGVSSNWSTEAWPKDIIKDALGNWIKGWKILGKDSAWYPCGVLCDKEALKYAEKRIPEELKTQPYKCRFIDTTTASPWRECYDDEHPMTRSESKYYKMQLLKYVSEDNKLVTGSETGHDAAAPYVNYFEGMMSFGPYRIPDAGRDMGVILDTVPAEVQKFQVGQQYRLPLWELVYHDSVVSYWYWGDYNNKLPAIWDKRDLFNILYGTPPMYMFNKDFYEKNKEHFNKSYKNICTIVKEVGYSEMTDFRILTEDKSVQQSQFSNGVNVTVNFGDTSYYFEDGTELKPMGFKVLGLSMGTFTGEY